MLIFKKAIFKVTKIDQWIFSSSFSKSELLTFQYMFCIPVHRN